MTFIVTSIVMVIVMSIVNRQSYRLTFVTIMDMIIAKVIVVIIGTVIVIIKVMSFS